MTLDDVRTCGRKAFLPLPNGAILRYQPDDGTVRVLRYPHRSERRDSLRILHFDIPREGWRHAPSCACSHCWPEGPGSKDGSRD